MARGFRASVCYNFGLQLDAEDTSEDGQIALNAEFKRVMVVKPDGAGSNLASMRKRYTHRPRPTE